jgi:hypothetical protein
VKGSPIPPGPFDPTSLVNPPSVGVNDPKAPKSGADTFPIVICADAKVVSPGFPKYDPLENPKAFARLKVSLMLIGAPTRD